MINEQQKEAIAVLNRLHGQGPNAGYLLTDEEYFMLMEYVLQETNCATDEHATHKGDEADDSVIIEDLYNRVIKQSDEIERLRNEKNLLVEKISRNYLGDLLRANRNTHEQGGTTENPSPLLFFRFVPSFFRLFFPVFPVLIIFNG